MKNLILNFATLLFLITVYACSEKGTNKSLELNIFPPSIPATSTDTIISLMKMDTTNYNQALKDIVRYQTTDTDGVKAFNIHALDLIQLLGLNVSIINSCQYKFVRAYMGLGTDNRRKLYLTPVLGIDSIVSATLPGRDTVMSFLQAVPNSTFVGGGKPVPFLFDLNAPCPTICPPSGSGIMDSTAIRQIGH